MEQLTKNRIKDLNRNKIYHNNPEVNKMVTQEQITLQNLINEFENKINEKENQLTENKEKIKQCLLEIQNKPLIQKNYINNNGLNNNYNYNYYLTKDNNNGNNNISEALNYNVNNNKNKLTDFRNINKKMVSLQSLPSYNNEIYNKKPDNKNGTTYAYYSNQNNNNQYEQQMSENEENINTINEIDTQSNN